MKTKVYIDKKEIEGKTFYFKNYGDGYHGSIDFRLWINRKLVKVDEEGKEYIELPCENARIIKTEKGNLVLRSCEGWTVFNVGVECGYRGASNFEILEPQNCEIFKYEIYHSPVGSLGISTYGLVNSPSPKIKVKWERSGRLYGRASKGIVICYADGRMEEIEDIQDGLEALEEIEKLTQE
jgi:hypothetical protein